MVNLVTIKPGEFENDPNADALWPFAVAVDENLKRLLAGVMARATLIIGDQRLLPFRATELPIGWYFMDGRKFLLSSDQGQVLNNLPAGYKTDWGIAVTSESASQYINVPKFFYTDGRGYFERAVNGTNRAVGSVEDDAIRNITGKHSPLSYQTGSPSGAIQATIATNNLNIGGTVAQNFTHVNMTFDASRVVPTAAENRVLNIGKTPAIFLGV